MNDIETLSVAEKLMRITWLEHEIDTCLSYDLPTNHLVEELIILNGDNKPSPSITVFVE